MRSFVAIQLPEAIHRKLAEHIEELDAAAPAGSIRWVRATGIHLTLKFLGEVEQGVIDQASQLLREIVPAFAPFTAQVAGLGCFPNIRRPRVIWVGIEEASGRLSQLHRKLETAFESLGFEPEDRAFHPHLTLGRVRRGLSSRVMHGLTTMLEKAHVGRLGEVPVEEVCLFRSQLRPTGAVYTKLATVGLRQGS